MVVHTIEICSGVGMLGEGLRAGLNYLGIETRTICHIEREAYPASVLASRMQEGALDSAPIWSDLLTFNARAWRGAVDCIVAGFPCQDLSVAGRRVGLDGKRSGLFFNILDIADDCGAQWLFLENVAGIASATASVVDEAEELEERAASRVVGELAERGWNAEWLTLSASEVGASHGRGRWFCFAWRELDNAGCVQRRSGHEKDRPSGAEMRGNEAHNRLTNRGGVLGNAQHPRQHAAKERDSAASGNDGNASRTFNAREPERSGNADGKLANTQCQCEQRPGIAGELACAGPENQTCDGREQRASPDCGCYAMADTSGSGCEGIKQRRALPSNWGRAQAHGSTEQFCSPLFAPGPNSPEWAGIISNFPWLTPALSIEGQEDAKAAFAASESLLHREPNGLACGLDFDARTQRLKCCCNGVVPAQAGCAAAVLIRRSGVTFK